MRVIQIVHSIASIHCSRASLNLNQPVVPSVDEALPEGAPALECSEVHQRRAPHVELAIEEGLRDLQRQVRVHAISRDADLVDLA